MRPLNRLPVRSALLALACASFAPAALAETAAPSDVPITQRIIRDGSIRYGVWVKVGDRSVEAMLDTGSTGLRVLPSVYRGDMRGTPTDVAFGAGVHLAGTIVEAPVEIGSRGGIVPVEVVSGIGCVADKPACGVPIPGVDSYLIGGDGFPSEGYSAILGIGLPFRGSDLANPLAAIGVTQWVVSLPQPYAMPEGHLVLDPGEAATAGFTRLARHGIADADGCIAGGPLKRRQCGTLLFDTGAPAMDVSYEGVSDASRWQDGAPGSLTFKVSSEETLNLDFKAGENEGLRGVTETPPASRDQADAFILAGVAPYLSYDILYDEPGHTVALKSRAAPVTAEPSPVVVVPAGSDLAKSRPKRRLIVRPSWTARPIAR